MNVIILAINDLVINVNNFFHKIIYYNLCSIALINIFLHTKDITPLNPAHLQIKLEYYGSPN